MIDDRNVRKLTKEMSNQIQKGAELFFAKELRGNLKDKTIYCDESIDFLDKFIKENVRNESEDGKSFHLFVIGAYLGKYVISKFQGNWVFDSQSSTSPYDFFIRCTKETDLYFMPFVTTCKRIDLGKETSLKSEINIIKNKIKEAKELDSRLVYFKKKSVK